MKKLKTAEIEAFANAIIQNKIKALNNDVNRCIDSSFKNTYQEATFTAILPYFSLIDFLAGIYCGDVSKKAKATKQVKSFLKRYFTYNSEQRSLLIEIYRHKLVHLFQPANIFRLKGRTYSWMISSSEPSLHLKTIRRTPKPSLSIPYLPIKIKIGFTFSISISDFREEIIDSANKYFKDLQSNKKLQTNLKKAIKQIYYPED